MSLVLKNPRGRIKAADITEFGGVSARCGFILNVENDRGHRSQDIYPSVKAAKASFTKHFIGSKLDRNKWGKASVASEPKP